jgi:hypothetical protein
VKLLDAKSCVITGAGSGRHPRFQELKHVVVGSR